MKTEEWKLKNENWRMNKTDVSNLESWNHDYQVEKHKVISASAKSRQIKCPETSSQNICSYRSPRSENLSTSLLYAVIVFSFTSL